MLLRSLLCVILLAALVPVVSLRAQVLYSTFGPNDLFDGSNNVGFGTSSIQLIATRFVPGVTGLIGQVEMAIGSSSGTVPVRIEIRPDAGGVPSDTVLSSGVHPSVGVRGVYVFTMSTAVLNAGQAYWLVPNTTLAGTSASWFQTNPQVVGTFAARGGGVGPDWVIFANDVLFAARIRATTTFGACCSPLNGGCRILSVADCGGLGLSFTAGAPCVPGACHAACAADLNQSGDVTVQDLFDYLAAYFAGCP